MKTCFIQLMLLAAVSAGCVAPSLERHALSQIQTVADFRYEATLRCLATVAADSGNVPSYAMLSNGSSQVQDTGIANAATSWVLAPVAAFKSELFGFTGAHAPQAQWTVSPVTDHTQLKALRAACDWVLRGQDLSVLPSISILADPMDPYWSAISTDPDGATPAPHFGVARRLAQLPRNWLCCGRPHQVPAGACCSAHCGETAVWVMPEGQEGLAEFTLVLQDVATLDVAPSDGSRPANLTPPLPVTLFEVQNTLPPTLNIDIKHDNGRYIFFQECADNAGVANVFVGQSVNWSNDDGKPHRIQIVTAKNMVPVQTPGSTVFNQTIYDALAGNGATGPVKAEMQIMDQGRFVPIGTFVLAPPSANPLYSQTLVYKVDRVIKPECRQAVENQMACGLKGDEISEVQIPWEGWINKYTIPYQGARTSVKPGASTSKPIAPSANQKPPPAATRYFTLPSGDVFTPDTSELPAPPPSK